LYRQLAQHLRSLQPKGDPPIPRGTLGNLGETLEVGRENGVLENNSGNISETRKDGGKVTMEYVLWMAYRNLPTLFRTVPSPTPYGFPFLEIGGLQLSYPLLSQEQVKLRTSNIVGTFTESIGTKAHKNVGNSSRRRSQGVPKIFRASMYRAHCAVIFAISQLSCLEKYLCFWYYFFVDVS